MIALLAERVKALLADHPEVDACEGVGVVVPGMVEHSTMRVLHAPTLGWRNVNLREALAAATRLPVQIENSGRACALAQAWAMREDLRRHGRRPGVRQHLGRRRRRRDDSRRSAARPPQHRRRVRALPLSLDGPRCSCGSNGCWEAYVSNPATLGRYFGGGPITGPTRWSSATLPSRI